MNLEQFRLHAEVEEKHWWFCGRRRIMRELVHRIAPPARDVTVVDIGCGTGGNIASLAEDYTCFGIDRSEEAIRLARSRFPNVRFVCGSDLDLSEVGGRVRIFLLMDVLEHVPDDSVFLSGLLKQLRPGDYLLLTVPADMGLWSPHDVSFGHYRRYDIRQLETLCSAQPVAIRLISYFNARLYPLVKTVRTLSRLRGRTWGSAGTDLKMPAWPLNGLLKRIFEGEAEALVNLLETKRSRGYGFGVSLVALLRREEG